MWSKCMLSICISSVSGKWGRGKGGEEGEGKRRGYRNNTWVILYNISSSLIISIMIAQMKTKVENNKCFILSV